MQVEVDKAKVRLGVIQRTQGEAKGAATRSLCQMRSSFHREEKGRSMWRPRNRWVFGGFCGIV
jgi:hypothetical protein